jgi:hypothetical protein
MNWFDDYEFRARILPAIIVFLPIMIPAFLMVYNEITSITSFLFSGIVFAALIYPLSFIVRRPGSELEKTLWEQWGGPPSTRVMRWRDNTFNRSLKAELHKAVRDYCGLELSNSDEEQKDPREADKKIGDAFSQVKHLVYHSDPNGMWRKYNAEYGFNRNLLGCKCLWIVLSVVGVIICGLCWYFTGDRAYSAGLITNLGILAIAVFLTRYILPEAVRDPAEYYASSVWHSFLNIVKRNRV